MTNSPPQTFAVIVAGGGPAGLAAALALARLGIGTAIAAAPHRPAGHDRDRRTAALFSGSVELLKNLGVWAACERDAAPLKAIRILDDTGALLKAPDVTFTAADVGLDAFGYNVPNATLVTALQQAAENTPHLQLLPTTAVTEVHIQPDGVHIRLAEGPEFGCRLLVAADGRKSIGRKAAGISANAWTYPQSALVTWFSHQRDHGGISTEFHRTTGPFTTVPMPGRASSLVWVESPAQAQRLIDLHDSDFRGAVETRLSGLLGTVGDIGPRAVFPLTGLTPDRFGHNRVALVGEAAHVIPPIGAQGLNLGLRDGAALADCLADAVLAGTDPGAASILQTYSKARHADVTSRVWAIDLLNRSLLSSLLPIHLARGFGLHLLNAVAPLRRSVIREGLQPTFATPTLMQPGGLDRLTARLGMAPPARPASRPA